MVTGDTRWDGDQKRQGIADARALLPLLDRLREALERPNWVSEDPDAHLLPHLRDSCRRSASPLAIERATSTEEGIFEVDLVQQGPLSPAGLRHAVFGLVGSIAEGATFIYEQQQAGRTLFEIATGLLDEQTPFRSHGHTIRFVIARSEPQ